MPRPRKHDTTIPNHIDQRKLPVGVYWDRRDRYWYTITRDPKAKRLKIGAGDALMSELHQAVELARGVDTTTLDHMLGAFEDSAKYKALAPTTQEDYGYCRLALQRHKTKLGCGFAALNRDKITPPLVQRLVDAIAEQHPSKANHVKRYLSAAFKWGIQRGYASSNPAAIVAQAKERKAHRMPERDMASAVVAFLRERGAYVGRRKGAVAPYLWAVAVIAYRCRMRSAEVRDLTDANAMEDGIHVARRKGSKDNVTRWTPDLREAWGWLVARRAKIWLRKPALRAKALRPLVVSEDGAALSKSALSTAWRRAMDQAVEAGIIGESERFGMHGLKHRGVTDTEGGREARKAGSGHKSDAMVDLYTHVLDVVDPAGKPL